MINFFLTELNSLMHSVIYCRTTYTLNPRITFILSEIKAQGYIIISGTHNPEHYISVTLKKRNSFQRGMDGGKLILNSGITNGNKYCNKWVMFFLIKHNRKLWFKYIISIHHQYFKLYDLQKKVIFYFPNGDSRIWEN